MCVNCLNLTAEDIDEILKLALYEFPIAELGIYLPSWLDALGADSPLRGDMLSGIAEAVQGMSRVRDAFSIMDALGGREDVSDAGVTAVDMGTGCVTARIDLPRSLYYETISEQCGFEDTRRRRSDEPADARARHQGPTTTTSPARCATCARRATAWSCRCRASCTWRSRR